jgi:hypothetical protein
MNLSDTNWTLKDVQRMYLESAESYQTSSRALVTRQLRKLMEWMESNDCR